MGCVPDVPEEPTAFIFKVTRAQPTNFGAEDSGKIFFRNDSKRGHFHMMPAHSNWINISTESPRWLYISDNLTNLTHKTLKSLHTNKTRILQYNIKRRCVRETIVSWKSNEYYITWVCVCSIRYPAYIAQAPYCHLWPARFYNIFPHYLINSVIFGKKSIEHKMCFGFF